MPYPIIKSQLLVAPAIEPVSLVEAKQFLRIDSAKEDDLINHLIQTTRQMAEKWLGKMLINQQWQMIQRCHGEISFSIIPAAASEITEVYGLDDNGETLIEPLNYSVEDSGQKIIFKNLCGYEKIKVCYIAGFGAAAEDVPAPIRQGILQAISHLYHHREATGSPPCQAIELWQAYRGISL